MVAEVVSDGGRGGKEGVLGADRTETASLWGPILDAPRLNSIVDSLRVKRPREDAIQSVARRLPCESRQHKCD